MPQKRSIPRVCQTCGVNFFAYPQLVKRGMAIYCTRACFGARHVRPIALDGETARVPLIGRNGAIRGYAVIDAADAEWVSKWAWRLTKDGYAERNQLSKGASRKIGLHRAILGLTWTDLVDGDHIDRNKLNCRRSNLRVVPKGKNQQNAPVHRDGTSQYRGVCWNRKSRKWQASVAVGKRKVYLGLFNDEHAAGAAAREARSRLLPYAVD